jgi:hypothetical protein
MEVLASRVVQFGRSPIAKHSSIPGHRSARRVRPLPGRHPNRIPVNINKPLAAFLLERAVEMPFINLVRGTT